MQSGIPVMHLMEEAHVLAKLHSGASSSAVGHEFSVHESATHVKYSCGYLVAQSCPTLCNPRDYSLPGSSVHGILPARILE